MCAFKLFRLIPKLNNRMSFSGPNVQHLCNTFRISPHLETYHTPNNAQPAFTYITINSFKIEYVSKEELTQAFKTRVKEALSNYLEPGLHLELIRVEQLKRSKSGKLKQFESLL